MSTCKISVALAYLVTIYCLSCIYYLIATQSVGTPFKDSLTPKQREIKNESYKIRRRIFYTGVGVSILAMLIIRPYEKC